MSGSGSSFSVATTIFVSLAICAVISYGVFYYFKQRLSVIEQSQMEQARVMQSFIARSIMQQQAHQQQQHAQQSQQCQEQEQHQPQQQQWHKEITVTESGLIEVSSDSESESDSDESQSSESSQSSDKSSKSEKWSVGDEIHQPDSLHEWYESQKKHIHIDAAAIDLDAVEEVACDENDTKKIISLNKTALGGEEADESESDSESESESEEIEELEPFELKIGYKDKDVKDKGTSNAKKAAPQSIQLNYSNMSVPALRQVAKERGLGGEDADLQKLKKKDLVQLLQ
jgi:hypothetical protein